MTCRGWPAHDPCRKAGLMCMRIRWRLVGFAVCSAIAFESAAWAQAAAVTPSAFDVSVGVTVNGLFHDVNSAPACAELGLPCTHEHPDKVSGLGGSATVARNLTPHVAIAGDVSALCRSLDRARVAADHPPKGGVRELHRCRTEMQHGLLRSGQWGPVTRTLLRTGAGGCRVEPRRGRKAARDPRRRRRRALSTTRVRENWGRRRVRPGFVSPSITG